MLLVANQITVLNLNAPDVIIKVIARNVRKKITTISGLFSESKNGLPPYFVEEAQKQICSELGKKCAAGATIIKSNKKVEKIVQIQGDNIDIIKNYILQLGVPMEKIKIGGIYV